MPSMRYTPNNPGGQLVEDPLDQIESGNRGAAIQAAGLNAGMLQNQQMTQLMLARLASDDYHYGQDRTDKLGMFNQGLQAQSTALDKEYGYLGARDQSADKRWQQQWQFQTDPNVNPLLKSQLGLNDAQTQEMIDRITQAKSDRERAEKAGNAAAPPTFRTPQEKAAYDAAIANGQNPAAAGSGTLGSRADVATRKIPGLQSTYESALDEAQAGSVPIVRYLSGFGELSSDHRAQEDNEIQAALQNRQALKQNLTDSGYTDEEAESQLKAVERKHRASSPTIEADKLYKALGW